MNHATEVYVPKPMTELKHPVSSIGPQPSQEDGKPRGNEAQSNRQAKKAAGTPSGLSSPALPVFFKHGSPLECTAATLVIIWLLFNRKGVKGRLGSVGVPFVQLYSYSSSLFPDGQWGKGLDKVVWTHGQEGLSGRRKVLSCQSHLEVSPWPG